jgi:hypothetical protein
VPLFGDPVHDDFASWILGFTPYGGGDAGEVELLAAKVTTADDGSFFTELSGLAQRRIAEGDAAAAKGHHRTACDCYLRAACSSPSPTTRSTGRRSIPASSRRSTCRWRRSTRRWR